MKARLLFALSCGLALAAPLSAQNIRDTLPARIRAFVPNRVGPGIVLGIVLDTLTNAVDSAEVTINALHLRATANFDGTFRFEKVKPGRYEISARRFGFAPQVRTLVVGDSGGTTAFALVPIAHALAPVITSTSRGGLSGVIGDTAFGIVPGALISVLASDRRTYSDSAGLFYINLHPGKFMIRVTHPGFAPRMMSVTIPNDSGRRVAIWLMPSDRAASVMENTALAELHNRLIHARPATSALFTREDIIRLGFGDAKEIATAGAMKPVADDCPVVIDGLAKSRFAWELSAADIETMEVYTALETTDRKPRRNAAMAPPGRAIAGGAKQTGAAFDMNLQACPTIVAWLRK